MTLHEFTFVLDRDPTDDEVDTLFDATQGDATPELRRGASLLRFDREADTPAAALVSARARANARLLLLTIWCGRASCCPRTSTRRPSLNCSALDRPRPPGERRKPGCACLPANVASGPRPARNRCAAARNPAAGVTARGAG
ncbi:hypothetical protein [Salinifilum ghardaiensis]